MLFLRALLAFLALPVVVAGLIPALIVRGGTIAHGTAPLAVGLLAIGCVQLFWCVRDFYVAGKGTLAPWDPPKHLVIVGLYRFVRNPMYVAVAIVLAGWALLFQSISLSAYLAIVVIAFHLRVVIYEEPKLRALFGTQWESYSAAVNRWIPRPYRGKK
jgi:protein-S-isoprenylcysteine O-methyltransferase Ste14